MKYFLHSTLLFLITAFVVISSCGNNHNNSKPSEPATDTSISNTVSSNKASYNLEKVERCEMKKKLKEISGLHYVKDDLFVAIQDESGKIFTVSYSNCDIVDELHFAGKGDYEDITLDSDYYYVLESMGRIYKVPRSGDTSKTKIYEIPFKKRMEFESIYLDPAGENLVMVCKNCPGKKNNFMKYAYAFNIKKEAFADEPIFSIDLGEKDLKPSATAINPVEKKIIYSLFCRQEFTCLRSEWESRTGKAFKPHDLQTTRRNCFYSQW